MSDVAGVQYFRIGVEGENDLQLPPRAAYRFRQSDRHSSQGIIELPATVTKTGNAASKGGVCDSLIAMVSDHYTERCPNRGE